MDPGVSGIIPPTHRAWFNGHPQTLTYTQTQRSCLPYVHMHLRGLDGLSNPGRMSGEVERVKTKGLAELQRGWDAMENCRG